MTTTSTATTPSSKRELCRQPWGTALYPGLAGWLSPVTWWRAAAFKRVDLRPLWTSCAALALPPALLAIYIHKRDRTTPSRNTSSLLSLWLTPWTAAFAWKASVTLQKLWTARKELMESKATTKDSAWECLSTEINLGRAYRRRSYDVYTPEVGKRIKQPILFLTGAGVDHAAYAHVASLFAKAGYLVAVVSAEPLRLVDEWLLPPRYIQRICSAVEKRHGCGNHWVLAGHSMGSFLCTKLAQTLNVKQIAMWASAPFLDYVADISKSNDLQCLVVQAEKDIVIEAFATETAIQRFWELLPSDSVQHTIKGGTHSGFGSYIGAWKPEVVGISEVDQQKEAVQVTVDFLEDH